MTLPETPGVSLDAAWERAERACAAQPTDQGMPSWPRLQGPFNTGIHPVLYQADVMEPNGHRRDDERMGLGPTPAAALVALAEKLEARDA